MRIAVCRCTNDPLILSLLRTEKRYRKTGLKRLAAYGIFVTQSLKKPLLGKGLTQVLIPFVGEYVATFVQLPVIMLALRCMLIGGIPASTRACDQTSKPFGYFVFRISGTVFVTHSS